MKVKLLTSRGGVGFTQNVGDIVDVGDAEGKRMIEAGQAEPHKGAGKEKATSKKQTEKAVKE